MNQKITLRSRPAAEVSADNFLLLFEPIHALQSGEVLVANKWVSLDPYVRGRMLYRQSYAPHIQIGEVIIGEAIGEVVESRSNLYKIGDIVIGMMGWQTHAVMHETRVRLLPCATIPPSWFLGAAGLTGITAWLGIHDICKPAANETVLVSSAAGSVGSIAGQLARLQDARVIGLAGTSEKCRYVENTLHFQHCFNYRSANWVGELANMAPQGVDCLFENVGGVAFDRVLEKMNPFSRIALCGLVAEGLGPHNHSISLRHLLTHRILLKGFIASDHTNRWSEIQMQLIQLLEGGQILAHESITDGIENAPTAFISMLNGENLGKALVRLR
jgi:NADPH-dependent curcumin reductase CurA